MSDDHESRAFANAANMALLTECRSFGPLCSINISTLTGWNRLHIIQYKMLSERNWRRL